MSPEGGNDPDIVSVRGRSLSVSSSVDRQAVADREETGQPVGASGTDDEGAVFPLAANIVLRQNRNESSGGFLAEGNSLGSEGNPVDQKAKVAGGMGRLDVHDDSSEVFGCFRRKRECEDQKKVQSEKKKSGHDRHMGQECLLPPERSRKLHEIVPFEVHVFAWIKISLSGAVLVRLRLFSLSE